MNLKNDQTQQKLRGGYYTPSAIGKYLWEWVSESEPNTMLEPAAGDGALVKAINPQNVTEVTAIEKFEEEARKISVSNENVHLNVIAGDFFEWYESNTVKFDAVIANPPYIRYQYLTRLQREVQAELLKKNGLKPNKLINSWVAFVVASIEMLSNDGRIGLVIPTDLLQVTYAQQLRKYLINSLSKLYIVTFTNSVFPGTQQDFLLVLGEKKEESDELEFKHIEAYSMDQIPNWAQISNSIAPLEGKQKWSDLMLKETDRFFVNEVFNSAVSFKNLAKVEIGITTGANQIFSLTKQEATDLQANKFVVPMVGRSTEASGIMFDGDRLTRLDDLEKKTRLLNLKDVSKQDFSNELGNYLKNFEQQGQTSTFKLRIRENWYEIPGVWAPEAFMLRRVGKEPKLFLNSVGAVSTDTFHRVTFNKDVNPRLVTFSFYSSFALMSFELAGRSFGGGALEILPGDIAELYLPRIDYEQDFDAEDEAFLRLDELLRHNQFDEAVEFVDEVLAERFGATYNASRTENIYKMLQSARQKN